MSDYSYGIVVDQFDNQFSTWTLFSGTACHLAALDASVCEDALHIGDVVQARPYESGTSIRRSRPFPDSVWSDGRRVIVRTIVTYSDEFTISSGRWKDERGVASVLLFSHDIGIIAVSTQWYNSEFYEAHENHLYAYAQFAPGSLSGTRNAAERIAYHWSIIEDRISLPATPSKTETREFLLPNELRRLPAVTLHRQGNSMLLFSHTLGHHLAIMNEAELLPGTWLKVTVIRCSPRDFVSHGCTYTVLRHEVVRQDIRQKITVVRDTIQMTMTINRSEPEPDNPRARLVVWHEGWGLSIDYDDDLADWIRQKSQFRALIQIEVSTTEGVVGRHASVKAVGPAVMPRLSIGPATPTPQRAVAQPEFEDVEALKKHIQAMENATPKKADQNRKEVRRADEGGKGDGASRGDSHRTTETLEPPAAATPHSDALDSGTAGPIPIRARDDCETEMQWRKQMAEQGWAFPETNEGDGGSGSRGSSSRRQPVHNRLNKRVIAWDPPNERIKVRQCLVTKVRYDLNWENPDMIQLFMLDCTPAFVVHTTSWEEDVSLLWTNPELTTVGNVVALRIRRSGYGWTVVDELWTFVMKLPLPMREVSYEPARLKSLELIVTAKCLCPLAQDRHNDRHRKLEKGFIMLIEEIIHNICYYGTAIDAREHDDFNFQMVVEPEECLPAHTFWKATELLWRIPRHSAIPQPRAPEPVPVHESTLDELFCMYGKLMENENLMEALHRRTGTDYKAKFCNAIEIFQYGKGAGLSGRAKRELECNENFLFAIVENAYSESIFKENGEKKLWKLLVRTVDGIKDWRRHMNNR